MTNLRKRYRKPDRRLLARRKHMPSVHTMPTAFIHEVLNSRIEGASPHSGKDYSHLLPEMRDELNRRMTVLAQKIQEKEILQREREQAQFDKIRNGIECTRCHTLYPHTDLEKAFYRRAGKKRHLFQSECKRCHKERTAERRALAKIDDETLPF